MSNAVDRHGFAARLTTFGAVCILLAVVSVPAHARPWSDRLAATPLIPVGLPEIGGKPPADQPNADRPAAPNDDQAPAEDPRETLTDFLNREFSASRNGVDWDLMFSNEGAFQGQVGYYPQGMLRRVTVTFDGGWSVEPLAPKKFKLVLKVRDYDPKQVCPPAGNNCMPVPVNNVFDKTGPRNTITHIYTLIDDRTMRDEFGLVWTAKQ